MMAYWLVEKVLFNYSSSKFYSMQPTKGNKRMHKTRLDNQLLKIQQVHK